MKNISLLLLACTMLTCRPNKTLVKNFPCMPDNPNTYLGDMKIPCYKVTDFQEAANKSVQTIHSEEFLKQLKKYLEKHTKTYPGLYSEAWKGLTAEKIISDMRDKIKGVEITTYGGVPGLWVHVFSGNVAYDGGKGPVRMNRWGIRKRDAADLANTIAHEVSHKAGLTHPHSDDDLNIAKCEPPYVIGSIVQMLIEGKNWKWDSYHCSHMK